MSEAGFSEDAGSSHEGDDQDKAAQEAAVERKRVQDMAQREAKNVQRWRRNVLVLMFVTGVLVTSVTYVFLKREQEEDFETSVRGKRSTVLAVVGSLTIRHQV